MVTGKFRTINSANAFRGARRCGYGWYGLAMHGFATIDMNASPEAVWSLISDVTQIGRFSPETFEAQWLDGAVGPAVGAKFRGHVKRNEKGPSTGLPAP